MSEIQSENNNDMDIFFNLIPSLICIASEDGYFKKVNSAWTRVLGFSQEELLSKPFSDFIHPEDITPTHKEFENRKRGFNSLHFINRYRCKDGSYRLLEWDSFHFSGGLLYASALDITECKNMEKTIADDNWRLENILTGTNAGTWEWNVNTGETRYNARWAEMLGYTLEELLPLSINTWEKLVHPEDLVLSGELLKKHFSGELEYFELEARMKHKNGSWVWVLDRGKVSSRTEGGSPLLMMGTHQDITMRKEAEARAQKANRDLEEKIAALQDSEEKYSSAFRISPDSININTMDGIFVDINEGFESLTGYSRAEVIGVGSQEINIWNKPEDRVKLIQGLKENGRVSNLESSFKVKDGSLKSCLMSASIIPINNVPHILSVTRDITEIREAEIKALDLLKQLNHKNKIDILGQLASGIAHDFNNILSGIMSANQLILMKENLSEKGQEYNKMIQRAAENGALLSNKLLTFSRKENVHIKSVNLELLIIDTIKILKTMLDKNISISFSSEGKNPLALLDFASMQNAILNICINSSHAMSLGGNIAIFLDVAHLGESECENSSYDISPGNFNKLTIEDSGHGISEDILDRILDPFFTTKEEGKGTGLGLAAVYRTIVELKGEIRVSSSPEIGTKITLYIPLLEHSVEEKNIETAILNGSGTILFVDDEELNRLIGGDILESLGYSVILASNGKEAIDKFQKNKEQIGAVILDMSMPVMDGEMAFRKIKEIDKSCPVLLCSGYSQSEKVQKLLDEGLNGIIPKPFRISEISQAIFKCLKKE